MLITSYPLGQMVQHPANHSVVQSIGAVPLEVQPFLVEFDYRGTP